MTNMILGIHSNVSGDDVGYTAGHAWISITRDGKATVYGLWPDAHPKTIDNGDKSDIRVGMEIRSKAKENRYYRLSDAQSKHFDALMKANIGWTYTNTCAAWASDVVESLIGEDIDSDDYLGFETPRELGQSISELEKTDPTSRLSPKKVSKNPAYSIQTSGR
jgi:hypothetical protein